MCPQFYGTEVGCCGNIFKTLCLWFVENILEDCSFFKKYSLFSSLLTIKIKGCNLWEKETAEFSSFPLEINDFMSV